MMHDVEMMGMEKRQFEALQREIAAEMLTGIGERMKRRGLSFDADSFQRQKSTDLESIAFEALTFGCDIWPTSDSDGGTFAKAA